MDRLASACLDLLFPPHCRGCGGPGGFLCPSCEAAAPTLTRPYCSKCAHPGVYRSACGCGLLAVDGIRAPYILDGVVRQAIHDLKYRDLRALAPRLGGLLAAWMSKTPVPGDLLVPVPLHPRRLRSRGYNQSVMLAERVAKGTGLDMARNALARIRDSAPQTSLYSQQERARNVKGGFRCVGDVRGARVVLVDDVVTTGSTMSACAQALKAAGARSVWGIALARQSYDAPR